MNELLTCEGLTKSYQKGTNALDDIELHIGFGRIVGIIGPTGSGKSTTLASMIDYINQNRADHILTIEAPIEYVYQSTQA